MKLSVGSLFSGFGGMDLGLERAGFNIKWQVEIDDYASRVLTEHFPNAERFGDIKRFPPAPDSAWLLHRWKERFYVDLICAGFPCQDISVSGKGEGISGERSGLFYEAIRVIRILGPRFVLLENVPALLGRGMGEVLGTLSAIGYDAEWDTISASHFGAPHIRDRVYLFAYPNGQRQPGPWQRITAGSQTPDAYREADQLVDAVRSGSLPYLCRGHDGIPAGLDERRWSKPGPAIDGAR